ncbi:hypothetical protein [Moritella viscosa]|uniref:Lipoprotein n=1 Tax=Moritella viscosa TaxID=80854 RepID=A0A090IEK8_9GAMM|nr:hypothetical protein [Moritella viscosa]CED60855.1 putative uncharacterized protein [Moritella viscosa]SGY96088.1 Putative uncharacterized protein [Moritella viscosa]SGZ08431.1 Putative uncharacterized protein [Moritella viscosa]SGZ08537.1 Putative uncharacterized protein [Moritella viscosa]SHO10460.1 Putative uncharacterized protein [Moritella viscosa]
MIRQILCITWLFFLVGCADKPALMKGAEAVIYPELQRFDITIKSNNTTAAEQQIVNIINGLLPVSPDTQWLVYYRLRGNRHIAEKAVKYLKASGVIPAQITVLMAPVLESDIALEIRQYYLFTSTCKPYSFEQYKAESGCFVDTLRMKQVVSPSNLIHVVKE